MNLTATAMAAAAFMLAHQVAGKAARDALFLSQFEPSDLPKIVVIAAIAAVLLSSLFSRTLERFGPRLVVPFTFLVSAALHTGEWIALDQWPRVVVALVYLHILGLGAILMSGFWAMASEMFDPREAKVHFGKIAGMGTAGGIAGGLLAERCAAWFSSSAVLILLAVFHVVCGAILLSLRSAADPGATARPSTSPLPTRREVFARAPYLVSLAILVLIGTTSAAMLDFLFKSGAAHEFGAKSPALLRYFALFYTGAQVLTFLVQTVVSRFALEKLGLSRTVGALPFAVGAGSIVAIFLPLFAAIASARALELILRGSLFRAGYELFYTPVPARDKRSVKVLIDVGCDRAGDAVGAGIVQAALWMGPALARTELLAACVVAAGIAAWIASRLDKAYTIVLERGLIQRAIELDFADIHDSTSLAVLRSVQLSRPSATPVPQASTIAALQPPTPRQVHVDPLIDILTTLRTFDAKRVEEALRRPAANDPILAPQLIRLLAWDDVAGTVQKLLVTMAPRIEGQLADALLDPDEDFAIRRRIPRLLARCSKSQRAADALCDALQDARFEVRFQCGRALDALRQQNQKLHMHPETIYHIVDKELSVSKTIWEGHRLLDRRESAGTESTDQFSFLDEMLRERANQSLEHVFSLLALVLPRDPLKVAFRALHTDDRQIRGLALEYLENVLPTGTKDKLWAVIGEGPVPTAEKSAREVLDDLMLSNVALQVRIQEELAGESQPKRSS